MENSQFSQPGKTYILIHGAWHGAWCWNKVAPIIRAGGHKVIANDLPGHGRDIRHASEVSLDDYANSIKQVANDQRGQVVLVGHSMAGMVISQAAEKLGPEKISALIYLDAFLPRDGESLFALVEAALNHSTRVSRKPMLVENIVSSPDYVTNSVNPEMAAQIFYHDCSEEDQKYATGQMTSEPVIPLATPVRLTDAIFGIVPKYFILCTETRDMDKSFFSTHVPCEEIYTLESSHSPFFSMPEKLAELLMMIG